MHTKRLEITFQDSEHAASVACPLTEGFVSLSGCQGCQYCGGLEIDPYTNRASVLCKKARPVARVSHPHESNPRFSPNAFAARTPLRVIMTKDVFCVHADASIESVAGLFLEKGLSGAPVLDANERPVGMVSKTDLVRAWYHKNDTEGPLPSSQVWEIMNPIVTILHQDQSIARAASLMAEEHLHRVPVVNEGGKVVGLLSSTDILRWLAVATGEFVEKQATASEG
jgi:CBS domain-containing protein